MMTARFCRLAMSRNVLFATLLSTDMAHAGMSEAERIALNQPACVQMKAFSQDITLLNDEMQNLKKSPNRRRFCDVSGRAITTIGSTVGYMQSHIGECTITVAAIDQMAALGRQLEDARRKACR